MPPHCDSLDGPVVSAARAALDANDVELVLPYVNMDGEGELRDAFDVVVHARTQGVEAKQVADLYFFETAVRVHRAGEGAPFTGLKPAGLDVGPVIPVAEEAIAAGSPDRLVDFLTNAVREEVTRRYEAMHRAKQQASAGVDQAREYVDAMLGLEVWSHKLYGAVKAEPHGHHKDT